MEERLKILVVDDDVVDRMAVRRALKAAGEPLEVSEAGDGMSAIAALKQQTFDCVFLDYRLPDGDALTLVQQVRAAGINVPLVILTGQGDEQIAVELMKAGASDYISKERVSVESLSRSMSNAIRIYRAETEAATHRERLKESEERYRLVLEGSNDGIWDWDINKNKIYWNDRLLEIIGIPLFEDSHTKAGFNRTWLAFYRRLHPEDRLKVRQALIAHLSQNTEFNLQFRLRHRCGEYRYCMTRGKAQRDSHGKPVRMAGIISDITFAKQTEAELRRHFGQLQTIYQIADTVARAEALPEIYQAALKGLQQALNADRTAVLLSDPNGVIRHTAWCGLSEPLRRAVESRLAFGLSDAQNPQPVCIPNIVVEVRKQRNKAAGQRKEQRENGEWCQDNSFPLDIQFWETLLNEGIRALGLIPLIYQEKLLGQFMLYYNKPHQFTEEEIQLVQNIASNVAFATERKRAQEALHRREQEFKALVENAPDIIARYDKALRLVYISPALERATGIIPDTLIGKTLSALDISETARQRWQKNLKQVFATGQEQVFEFDWLLSNGITRFYQARLVPELATDGSPEYVLSVARDITERKRSEDSQRFLADATNILSLSLDYQTTLENLAQLAVPKIADWCAIDVMAADSLDEASPPLLCRVAVAQADPAKREKETRQQGQGNSLLSVSSRPLGKSSKIPVSDRARYSLGQDSGFTPFTELRSKVLATGQSQFYPAMKDESEMDASFFGLDPLGVVPKSIMCVPLVARGRSLGVITLALLESGRQYTQADLELVEDLARRAGLAVDNARLYREAQEASDNLRRAILILGEQQQQLRALQRLTNLLNQRLANLPDLLQVMVQSVCDAIPGAQFCLIVLHNPQCDRLVLTVTAGMGTERLRLEDALADGEGWLHQVVATEHVQCIEREGDLPASVCAVAIESSQAGRMGILAIGHWEDTGAFDEEDRHLLVAVGEQAAIAINNARLIKTLEEREERLAQQNETLAQQNQELENQRHQIHLQNLQLMEAARLKSQFLATMSHELRTPMNAIIGFSQLLLRQWKQINGSNSPQLTPLQFNMMERILENGKHLLSLINDLLDLSKIEAGRMQLQGEEINLSQLVRATMEELRPLAEEKQLDLQLSIRLHNPLIFNDPVRLRQILYNLLSNAIKFTPTGIVRVEVWEPSQKQLAFMVQDTGIGIAPENIERIFEQFRQVDQSLKRKYDGTGLGLAITNSLVEMMNGTITVESSLGEGTNFRVEIPRQIPSCGYQSERVTTKKILR